MFCIPTTPPQRVTQNTVHPKTNWIAWHNGGLRYTTIPLTSKPKSSVFLCCVPGVVIIQMVTHTQQSNTPSLCKWGAGFVEDAEIYSMWVIWHYISTWPIFIPLQQARAYLLLNVDTRGVFMYQMSTILALDTCRLSVKKFTPNYRE